MKKEYDAETIPPPAEQDLPALDRASPPPSPVIKETGGVQGLEPTRYGDWEKNGRCVDF